MQVVHEKAVKERILQASHDDTVGGCYFSRVGVSAIISHLIQCLEKKAPSPSPRSKKQVTKNDHEPLNIVIPV